MISFKSQINSKMLRLMFSIVENDLTPRCGYAIKYYDIISSLFLSLWRPGFEERSSFASFTRRHRRCTLETELACSRENSSAAATANPRQQDCPDKMEV